MPQMMDKPTENPSEDRASLESNGKTPTNGVFHSVRTSIQQVVENIPLSPSLSAGSPVTSPLKNIAEFFQKKKEDEAEDTPGRKKGLKRSQTAPNMARAGGPMNRMRSFGQSLRLIKQKDREEVAQEEVVQEKVVQEEVVQEEVVQEEVVWEEAYTLPEIPHTPLSVMQINKLIDLEVLEEAHLNLLALRQEFKQEYSGEDSPMQLAKKEKDLSLLYGHLREKISTIVCNSNSFPSRNKELLVLVARIIQEEERRSDECGGLQDSWMESWRKAVGEGVQMKVDSVHLEQSEQNVSWLAVHLGLLGKAIVEDLENVKRELQSSYPPSFKVFSTYVNSYHRVLGQHLKKLEQQVTDLKDMHALLDWIINRYKSDKIMGSAFLQADMKDESLDLQLEDDFLEKLKDKYCCRVKGDLSFSLTRITDVENEEVWMEKKVSKEEDTVEDFPTSNIVMDIWTRVKGIVQTSGQIDAQLKQKVTCSCLEELKQFPKRFETEFRSHCSSLRPQRLWTDYQITYINSFSALQQPMEEYQAACPDEVEGFRREVRGLIDRLMKDLEDQFKESVKPYLRRMMTRKWLTSDDDFKQLRNQTELLSLHCSRMRPPLAQEFASRLHYHVVKEYIGQLMKNNYSCKNRKHEKAAMKIREQCCVLRDLFEEMKSTHDWLHPVGDDLSDIMAQNKANIKDHLQPIVEHYPDFSKKHLIAVLYFRGLLRGRKHRLILQRLSELKRRGGDDGNRGQVLFGDMQVAVNTDCLSSLPFSCLSFLRPNN